MKRVRYSEEELERIAELYEDGNVGMKTYEMIAEEINEEFFNNEPVRNAKTISYGIWKAQNEGYL